MEFGKTHLYKSIEYSLAGDRILFSVPQDQQAEVYLGTPGWNQKEWIKRIYPQGCPARDFLYHYSRRLSSIELNSTHYATPSDEKIIRWREMTPADFRFVPKVPQKVSHHGLIRAKIDWEYFVSAMMNFEDNLGPSFLQLPDYFEIKDFSLLQSLIESTPKDFPLAIEFRNPTFFEGQNIKQRVAEFLAKEGVSLVITDTAGRRDIVHSTLTTTNVIIRFIGNLHPRTDHQRIEDWVEKIDSWFQQGLEKLYFFTHQPENLNSIDLADHTAKYLNERLLTNLPPALDCEEELKNGPQGSLF